MSSSFREIRIADIVLPEYIRESGAEQVMILSSYSKGISQEDVGKMCNLSRERVNRLIQMGKLPRACRKYFVDNPND